MDPEIAFAPRPAKRQVVTLWSLFLIAGLTGFALLLGGFFSGCSSPGASQIVRAAETLPTPSAAVTQAIRAKVAAVVKSEVQAHPQLASWMNFLAQKCFEIAGFALPSPSTLESLFRLVVYVAPKSITALFDQPIGALLAIYTADHDGAFAAQIGSKPYLTAFGQGIQDGVKAAGVSEAP